MYDSNFLKLLDQHREKTTYVRITALDNNDYPREQIEGRVTGGSVNVDGASAVRRSCSLSLVALEDDTIITDSYWYYNNKFKLEIGLENRINPEYENIIWFKMGIYIVSSFSKSRSTNNLNISISGKDKMCRLNGEVSGNLPMSNDFGVLEEVDGDGNIKLTKLTIYTIIQKAIQEYGQERLENIIINDLGDTAYELWEYRGDDPMYMIIQGNESEDKFVSSNKILNIVFDGETKFGDTALNNIEKYYSFNALDKNYNDDASTIVYGNGTTAAVAKIEYGETAGYHQTPLVYNSDLILSAGEAVTSLLDKLKNMLGDFEYFYNLDGKFIFQKKKTYVYELFSPVNGDRVNPTMVSTPYAYRFEDASLFTSISESPNINNLKNEFSVWGTRKSASGADVPIHVRYAVDKKPTSYCNINSYHPLYWYYIEPIFMWDEETWNNEFSNTLYEIIETSYGAGYILTQDTSYQGPKTYFRLNQIMGSGSEPYRLINNIYYTYTQNENNKLFILNSNQYYQEVQWEKVQPGQQYYWRENEYNSSDYDWRELIYQMAVDFYQHGQDNDYYYKLQRTNPWVLNGKTGYEQYYSDLQGFWRELYNPNPTHDDIEQYGEYYDVNGSNSQGDDKYWNKKLHTAPNSFNFWFDFLDCSGELDNYSISKINAAGQHEVRIGTRTKVVNENSVKSIYYKEIPEARFIISGKDEYDPDPSGGLSYSPIWIQENMENLFYRSAQGMSAIEKVNELISQHTARAEGLTLTCIPIYYLQPNTRIYVDGYGDYTLDKISYNLNYNGTMNLTCTKIINTLY